MCERNTDGTYAVGHQGLKDESNGRWKGDKVGCFGSHEWLYTHFGKADHCEHCHKGNLNYQWANVSGKYLRDRNDYITLCVSCHRRFDKGIFCSKGHPFFGGNLWVRRNGWRVCRTCVSERSKLYTLQRKVEKSAK